MDEKYNKFELVRVVLIEDLFYWISKEKIIKLSTRETLLLPRDIALSLINQGVAYDIIKIL